MLLATLVFAMMHTFVKSLPSYHVFELVFFRSIITSVFCMIYLRRYKISFIGNRQKDLILRAFYGIISMTLFFFTLQNIPMGAAVTLKYLSPLFTAVFAVLLIKEKIRPTQWFFFFTALLGVVLLKGFDSRIDVVNLTLAIIGALFGGLVYVIIRRIGQSEHPMVIINYFMLSSAVLTGLAMIPFWKTPDLYDLILLLGVGITGYFGQVYMTKAFQIEAASRVAPIKYMEVIYTLIIGLMWFSESYTFLSFLGILLILGSMLMNLVLKRAGS